MKKNTVFISIISLLVILIIALILISIFSPLKRSIRCHNNCIKEGWQDGGCQWQEEMNESEWNIHMKRQIDKYNVTFPYAEIINHGSCVEAFLGTKSNHCGNEGQ